MPLPLFLWMSSSIAIRAFWEACPVAPLFSTPAEDKRSNDQA